MPTQNDLMIEVAGSSLVAVKAIDKVIAKLSTLQDTFDKLTPSLNKFTEKINSIATSSKAIVGLKAITDSTNRQALSAKDAESRMAMYQARLDRATVSMERSRVASIKLAQAQQKLKDAANFETTRQKFTQNLKSQKNHVMPDGSYSIGPTSDDDYNQPIFKPKTKVIYQQPDISGLKKAVGIGETASVDTSKVQSAVARADSIGPTSDDDYNQPVFKPKTKVIYQQPDISGLKKAVGIGETASVDTSKVQSAVARAETFIDSLSSAISNMSAKAQAEFDALAGKLTNISMQIDNQQALYRKLQNAAAEAAEANGKDSTKYLQLEKRMLSADEAISRLIAKQEKLKATMSDFSATDAVDDYTKATANATKHTSLWGKESKKATSSAMSGLQKILSMMEKMFIRIIAFRIFSAVSKSITDGLNNIAQASSKANASLSAISTSSLYLKNSIASAVMPIVEALTPAITWLTDKIAGLFNMLGMLNARIFGGATSVTVAKKANVDYAASLGKTKKAADEVKRSLMGFDEINALTRPSNSNDTGFPEPKDMFETVNIPASTLALADKIKEKLKALQPLFKGLSEVFRGFWDVIKRFADTYFYKWLCNIGDWMAAHPDTMYQLGKGLGYVAIGLLAFKSIKWLSEITGISKLVDWLWNLHKATKGVTKAFDEKNVSLDKQTSKTKIETKGLRNLVPWLAGAAAAALGLGAAFGKVKMPSLNPGSDTVNQPLPQPMPQPIPAPAFVPVIAPAIVLDTFLASKLEYLKEIAAPAFITAFAPAIALGDFIASKLEYLSEIVAPVINQAVAPAIDLASGFQPSLNAARQAITEFSTSTQAMINSWGSNLSLNFGATWNNALAVTSQKLSEIQNGIKQFAIDSSTNVAAFGTNVMANFQKTAQYIPSAISAGLSAAGKLTADWINSTSKGFVTWGENIISTVGKAAEGMYQNFVGGLSAAWNQFTGFMSGVGESIGRWWDANSSWAAPAAVGLTAVGVTAAIVLSGGAAAVPAALALAPVGLATGGLITAPTYSLIGEGKDNEAVIPLNNQVFARIGQGISENGGGASEDVLYRAFCRALHEMPAPDVEVKAFLDSEPVASRVETRIKRKNMRYNPVMP